MLLTSHFRIFFIKLQFNPESQILSKIEYKEATQKGNFFSGLFSYTSVYNQETNKIFVLNPFPHIQFVRNNKKNNIIYLLNESSLKKVEFDISDYKIESEVRKL
jgi:hypothetical protein